MAEGQSQQYHHQLVFQNQHQQQPPQRPRLVRSTPGEIVEVQGGHIVRSTGRKDRHSKVCTAKGPRDRRVRLSANTAIQFYDVQDRLGYDRPSKAVDWLIKNAKSAIDELAELPAWHPTATSNPPPSATSNTQQEAIQRESQSSKKPMSVAEPSGSCHNYGFVGVSSSFLPPSLDSDAIADTIKSFFPMAAATSAAAPSSSQPLGYQNYPPDLLSRSSSQNQDLRLSLQSFQDPIYHHQQHHHNNPTPAGNHAMFAGYNAAGASMPQWNVAEMSGGGGGSDGGGGGGFMFNVLPPQTPQALPLHPMLGQGQFFTQRGPLQSSTPPFVRTWVDPMAAADNPMHPMFHPSVQSIGFAPGSSSSGFSGFRIPARIQGEEEQDGISNKPSSASSGSHH